MANDLRFYNNQSPPSEDVIESVFAVSNENLSYSWSYDALKNFFLASKRSYLLQCEFNDNTVAGFVFYALDLELGEVELLKIVVDKKFQGSGMARRVFDHSFVNLEAMCKLNNIYLDVRESNIRAIKFYSRIGFKEVRRVKRFYSDGSDSLGMLLSVDATQ